ncbi:(deoxy)nucleoside triphosphate pyrophosphohydrolase [Sphingomonas endophytica]
MAMLVVAVALIDARGRCLMQQRPRHRRHGGLWEFPGGKVEPGELPASALVRELAEELAIVVDPAALEPVGFATDAPVTMLLYRCHDWRGTPVPLEAEAFRWDRPEALAGLPMPPVDVPLLAALARFVAHG